ncbi:hypothetical protein AALP_AA1G295000 [Arabis alpina]|uniref:EF-hand domain-containing protein n=1 Tax=Arabis alpina TaxID=50452 RepID=A0A087HRH5_ARAAL|nr:hypothetical protein AALP_AA1G295000 [Arabis alpina]
MARLALFLSFLSLALTSGVHCRVLSSVSEQNPILVSDGVQDGPEHGFISLDPPNRVSKDACIHVYGFLPCADNVGGYLFQLVSFGTLLMIGEYFLSEGRSKLFLIFEVGFYGGVVFPLLRMFPRIVLILSTGLMESPEIANSMVGNTVGVTVGYTVFALTIQWGACVVFGMTDSDRKVEEARSPPLALWDPRRRDVRKKMLKKLIGASIVADPKNKKAAGIMLLTILPFIMITLSEFFDSQSWRDIIGLITLIVSGSATLAYFIYSYFDEADQEKSLDHAKFELMSEVHKHLQIFSPKTLLRDGQLSQENLKKLFDRFDVNQDGKIQKSELNNMRLEFEQLEGLKYNTQEVANKWLEYFDDDRDGEIDKNEFERGISKWLDQYKLTFDSNDECQSDESPSELAKVLKVEEPKESLLFMFFSNKTLRAYGEVILGIGILMFLARPFMTNIELLSESAGVPSFYVVFAVIPLVRNLKSALSAHFCRNKDKARITSDTFAEIYSDVTMNNLIGISCIPAYVRSTYPFWICVLAFALYFISLLLVFLHFKSSVK